MTKSRKRMLLSSIAMLLVALVALGSATYAWFTVSKTVDADAMQVKAVATAGLEISKDDGKSWNSSVSFSNSEFSLKPVSYVPGGEGYIPAGNVSAEKGKDSAYTGEYQLAIPASDKAPSIPATAASDTAYAEGHNTYFATYRVQVRSAAVGTSHTIKATVTAPSGDAVPFARAALIEGNEVAAAGVKKVYGTTAETDTVCNGTSNTKAGSVTVSAWASDATGLAPVDDARNANTYLLVVWFEGTDDDCNMDNVNKLANLKIVFEATDM